MRLNNPKTFEENVKEISSLKFLRVQFLKALIFPRALKTYIIEKNLVSFLI